MPELARFYVVEASALPEVFLRVAEAKEYLNNGQAQSSAEASRMAGISRSAFYKYKDAFSHTTTGRIPVSSPCIWF